MKKHDKKVEPIIVELSLARVDYGGNTGDKMNYYYAFSMNTILLCSIHTEVIFKLSESTDQRFKMDKIIYSDGQTTMTSCKNTVADKGKQLKCENVCEESCVINISVLCSYEHEVNGKKVIERFNCDPQVLNDPEPTGPIGF